VYRSRVCLTRRNSANRILRPGGFSRDHMPIDLTAAVASLSDVQSFILGGDLSRTLAKSSNCEIQAAGFALRPIARARDPKDDVRRAANHLLAAQAKIRQSWTSLTACGGKNFRMKAYANANRLDQWVCCALAICYLFLREPALVKESIRLALDAEENDSRYLTWIDVIIGAAGGLASSVLFESSFASLDEDFVFHHQQCKEFCKKAEELAGAM
jgi:hypothetical protein